MFILDVKSGFIGKEILRDKLFDAVYNNQEISQMDEERETNIYNFNEDYAINGNSFANETDFEQGTIGEYSVLTS